MNAYLPLWAAVVVALQAAPADPVPFDDALAQKKITASAVATGHSAHYQQPVTLHVKNITASPLNVTLPTGRYFRSSDTTEQNFVSTEPVLFALAPGETKQLPVAAMCVNHHKGSPDPGDAFSIQKAAGDRLAKTAQYIYENKLSGSYLGQTVMWCVSDNESLENVFGYDGPQVAQAVKFLSALTGKPVPPAPAPDDYLRNPRARPVMEAGGSFEFRFSSPKAVHIAMFDKQNIAVRELYNNPNEPAGSHKVDFVFDPSVYNDDIYYVRFLVDNRVLMEHEMRF